MYVPTVWMCPESNSLFVCEHTWPVILTWWHPTGLLGSFEDDSFFYTLLAATPSSDGNIKWSTNQSITVAQWQHAGIWKAYRWPFWSLKPNATMIDHQLCSTSGELCRRIIDLGYGAYRFGLWNIDRITLVGLNHLESSLMARGICRGLTWWRCTCELPLTGLPPRPLLMGIWRSCGLQVGIYLLCFKRVDLKGKERHIQWEESVGSTVPWWWRTEAESPCSGLTTRAGSV